MPTFALVLIIVSVTCKLSSTVVLTNDKQTRLETVVTSVMECKQIPGVNLALVKGNETWTKGFGKADTERDIDVTTDTLFGIGSVTKSFTTTLLAMLLNDTNGRFTWISKLHDILGDDFAFVDDYRTRELTLRDLLTHRTGLATPILPLFAGYDRNITRAEIARRFRFLPEVSSFRDTWEYNNWAYALAGYIVEVLSRESYEDNLEKRIFQPLGMTKTRILGHTISANDNGVAKPYIMSRGQMYSSDAILYEMYPFESSGAIASSANDMTKWLQFLMRNGRTCDGVALVSSSLLDQVFLNHEGITASDQASLTEPTYPVGDLTHGYGYGWFTSIYRGYKKTNHGGLVNSYVTNLELYFDLDLGLFLSFNGPGTVGAINGLRTISYYMVDMLLGKEPWLNSSTACTFPSPWEKIPPTPTHDFGITNSEVKCIECFTGKYGHRLYDDIEVKASKGSSSLELYYKKISGSLNTTNTDTMFMLDLWDPFRLYVNAGNNTGLATVVFGNLEKGKYNLLTINDLMSPHKLEYYRNVSFNDDVKEPDGKKETNGSSCGKKGTSGQAKLQSSSLVCFVLFLVVNMCHLI